MTDEIKLPPDTEADKAASLAATRVSPLPTGRLCHVGSIAPPKAFADAMLAERNKRIGPKEGESQ